MRRKREVRKHFSEKPPGPSVGIEEPEDNELDKRFILNGSQGIQKFKQPWWGGSLGWRVIPCYLSKIILSFSYPDCRIQDPSPFYKFRAWQVAYWVQRKKATHYIHRKGSGVSSHRWANVEDLDSGPNVSKDNTLVRGWKGGERVSI